jgi:hypothetical protein
LARFAVIALLPLGFAGVGSAQAAGLTTVFDPNQWTFVNTNPAETPPAGQYTACTPSPLREQACLDGVNDNGFTLVGSGLDFYNPDPSPAPNTTSLTLVRNSNPLALPLTFKWSFDQQTVTSSTITMTVSAGTFDTAGSGPVSTYTFSTDYSDEYAFADLPPGASLTFSIFSDNSGANPIFTMDNFQEVPAPLPITGSSAVLLYSRRLRRRTLTASKQPPALHPTTGKVLSLAEQRSRHQHQRALNHYGSILGGPLVSGLPTTAVSSRISNTISSSNV